MKLQFLTAAVQVSITNAQLGRYIDWDNYDLIDEIDKGQVWKQSDSYQTQWKQASSWKDNYGYANGLSSYKPSKEPAVQTAVQHTDTHVFPVSGGFADYYDSSMESGFGDLHGDGHVFPVMDGKAQTDASLANSEHVNGFSCWTCCETTGDSAYADCKANGKLSYCEGEQFHCYIAEKREYGRVRRV